MAYCTKEDVIGELHPTLKLHMSGHYDQLHAADPTQPDFSQFLNEHIAKAEACANASLARAYRNMFLREDLSCCGGRYPRSRRACQPVPRTPAAAGKV